MERVGKGSLGMWSFMGAIEGAVTLCASPTARSYLELDSPPKGIVSTGLWPPSHSSRRSILRAKISSDELTWTAPGGPLVSPQRTRRIHNRVAWRRRSRRLQQFSRRRCTRRCTNSTHRRARTRTPSDGYDCSRLAQVQACFIVGIESHMRR